MAIKDIIDTAVDVGKTAVTRGREAAERRLRGGKEDDTPSRAAAPKPGEAGAPKSATAPTRAKKAKPKKAKPKAKAKAKPAKKRSTATRAAATSADEVKKAAEK
jgi:hypothetical protein